MSPPAAPAPRRSRATSRPATTPQGRALYHGPASRSHHPAAHHAHGRTHRSRVPSATSGLAVARRRVRETPWDSAYWIELADLLYKRGEFDLATRAYRRVQELCSFGTVAQRGGSRTTPQVPWIGPGRQVVPPAVGPTVASTPTPSPTATPPEPRVPFLRSPSGRTRAIRLKDSNILVALTTDLDVPPVGPVPPAATGSDPGSPRATAPEVKSHPVRRRTQEGKTTADEKLRSVLQRDLERVLKMFEKDAAASDESKEGSSDPPA